MSVIEPSLPTLPPPSHTLPEVDSKRHLAEDTLPGSVQLVKASVDDANLVTNSGGSEGRAGTPLEGPEFVSSIPDNEPIVTRKELWSYYCEYFCAYTDVRSSLVFRSIQVYYNGDNVRSWNPAQVLSC